jgi:preprotein translocase subunit SecA
MLVEAFALVREAATRTLRLRPYFVQLLGAIAMHHGSIAVMATGEGKTLTATMPVYLAALAGRGVHVATANDYLAQRDAEQLRPLFDRLGVSLGIVLTESTRDQRRDAYQRDITYATIKEIGFDFLRDRLWERRRSIAGAIPLAEMLGHDDLASGSAPVHRGHHVLLLDEADNVLIDEARTPLIVSAAPNRWARTESSLYRWAAQHADRFEADVHYRREPQSRVPILTVRGRRLLRQLELPTELATTSLPDLYHHQQLAIQVNLSFARDRQYVVRDNKVVIVDENTGRLAEGRQWRAGIHQAIEAREGLEISVATGEDARITVQDLCLLYQHRCGMTGTVAGSARELRQIYRLPSFSIPTHRPCLRQQWPTRLYPNEEQKWSAIVEEIQLVRQKGRPVLVGTRSINRSEHLSRLLTEARIDHVVLNARQLAREADIVAQAGRRGQVTVATNMAGRGTDIRLEDGVAGLGGLHVICTELHDAARIDRQLIGRCARQGDPGSYRQFLSLEDDILESGFGRSAAKRLVRWLRRSRLSSDRWIRMFAMAQSRVERIHFQGRRILLYRERQRQILQREMGLDPYLDSSGL